eukprot:scaffold4150_cov117-Cylindrotheca_fusiformis.AAC.10
MRDKVVNGSWPGPLQMPIITSWSFNSSLLLSQRRMIFYKEWHRQLKRTSCQKPESELRSHLVLGLRCSNVLEVTSSSEYICAFERNRCRGTLIQNVQ